MKKTIKDVNFNDKTTLVRVDFNVPVKDGIVTDDKRIRAALPTIKYLIENNAKLVIFSHLGRVKNEEDKTKNTIEPVAKKFEQLLGKKITFINATRGKELESAIKDLKSGEIVMFQNTRYEDFVDGKETKFESKNDSKLGKYWAGLGEIFVNDAFGTAHREHASNVGIAKNIKESALGFLMEKEVSVYEEILKDPKRPFVAVMGGSKVSDKILLIDKMLEIADKIIIIGAMANTFLKAQNKSVGISRIEEDKIDLAKKYLDSNPGKFVLPIDFTVAPEFKDIKGKEVSEIPEGEMALDIGKKSIKLFKKTLKNAKTIVWNGPAGVFEFKNFENGTKKLCGIIAKNSGLTVVGGGDSAAAAIKYGYENKFKHVSTGGGASLEYLEGKELPGIKAIQEK